MRTRVGILVAALLTALGLVAGPAAATSPTAATPDWAPADSAAVHPGVMTTTDGAQCTSNFVFYETGDSFGSVRDIYIGQAAHCASTEGNTGTNGCTTGTLPPGDTKVEVEGASQPGTLVYSSWATMQQIGESDPNICQYNDFALVKLHTADHDVVNPTIPFWGGPTGVTSETSNNEKVYSYGNSSLRLGIQQLSHKEGYSLGQTGDGWTHQVYTLTPGIPGDSGSAFIDSQGRAFGVLATVQVAPLAASNGVTDVARALDYMEANTSFNITLAGGTQPFSPGLLP